MAVLRLAADTAQVGRFGRVIALQPGSLHDGKAEGSFCLLPNGNLLLTPMPSPESSLELALMAGAEPMAGVRPII